MCLLRDTGKACGINLTSKNLGSDRKLNQRWIKRQQSVWGAMYAVQIRGLDTERWHSKIENLEEYIARAIKQYSLVNVLDAIANGCLVKAAQGVEPDLQRQWSGSAHIVRNAANEIDRRGLGDRRSKGHSFMLYAEAPNSVGGIDWIRQGLLSQESPSRIRRG
jgi:hypothetical protein